MLCLGINVTPATCFQSCLIGIVVPDHETLPEFAAKLGIKGSYEDICKNSVSFLTFSVGYRYIFNSEVQSCIALTSFFTHLFVN